MYSIFSIANIINAKWLQQKNDVAIEHILLDSRKLLFPNTSIFFALSGERRNGKTFIRDLYNKGVRNFVVDESFLSDAAANYIDANFLQVKDVLQGLQQLSAQHRQQFTIPIIGITGSNGKTIVKEWLYQLLHNDFSIVRNPKSYNSQIGVPLSVWQINTLHNLGIFEAGVSQPDEMQQLEKIIKPTIGIFTNIGEAHSEGFLNTHQKINEKLKLFIHSNVLIYCADNSAVNEVVTVFSTTKNTLQLFSWSQKNTATLQIISIHKTEITTTLVAIYLDKEISCIIPFTDNASIENAVHCWCVLLYFKLSNQQIAERLLLLNNIEMRLELKQGINHCSVINDSYSADINSLSIALNFLSQQQQHPNRTLILSDILQSGKTAKELYGDVAYLLQQNKVNRLIGIGTEIASEKNAFKNIDDTVFLSSTNDFKQQFNSLHFNNETILLKGARLFEFEQISRLLEQKVHQTVLEINLNAITHNLNLYQQQLNKGVKIMAMVKAFSYGSGGFEIANLLQFHAVDYLAVAYADEGVELRKAGITLPIMVMNAEETTFDVLVQYNLEPELFSFNILQLFKHYLENNGISYYPVHIKIDTGMHRLGFLQQDIEALLSIILSTNLFKIQSVFSHLVASDSAIHNDFTQYQFKIFNDCCAILKSKIPYPFMMHIANTSAIHQHKNMQLDMVRLGIGLYGIDSNAAMQQKLKNVTTLRTTISQIKKIKAGESVGYSRKGLATKDSVIATVRIGYADGYPRSLSNGVGKMWVAGKFAPVMGNICMDMTMLDVTDIDVEEGDDVIVFGEELSVHQLSEWANTIPYEILTGISQRVKRIYYQE